MRNFYFFIFFIISYVATSQDFKCDDFKIGTFKMKCTNHKLPSITAIRTEKFQREIDEETKKEIVGTIKWISDCHYELIFQNASKEINGKIIHTEIKLIENGIAFCKSTIEGISDLYLEFEMTKIN